MSDPLIPILRKIADEIARREGPAVVVPLTVGELPERKPYLPCIWLDDDGRPTPVLGLRYGDDIEARLAAKPSNGIDDPVLYPESAAPALWERFLAVRVGRVG